MIGTWIMDGAAEVVATWRIVSAEVTSVDYAVSRHLSWFVDCQARGMSWRQVSRVLADAGMTRESGAPLLPSHLSTVVSRQRRLRDARSPAGAAAPLGAPGPPPGLPEAPRLEAIGASRRPTRLAPAAAPVDATTRAALRNHMTKALSYRNPEED